jgi:hypothetical protein
MKTVAAETQIMIKAPIDKVWQAMLNTDDYPRWNPFVVLVERKGDVSKPGSRMKLFVRWLNGKQETSDEEIEEVQAPAVKNGSSKQAHWSYRFKGKLDALGLVHALRYQWLEEQAGGTTLYRTREEFSGLLKVFIPLAKVQDGFERQAKALRDYLEQQ